MTAFVRVCGPPNSAFLVGYPGKSATLEGTFCFGNLVEEKFHLLVCRIEDDGANPRFIIAPDRG